MHPPTRVLALYSNLRTQVRLFSAGSSSAALAAALGRLLPFGLSRWTIKARLVWLQIRRQGRMKTAPEVRSRWSGSGFRQLDFLLPRRR